MKKMIGCEIKTLDNLIERKMVEEGKLKKSIILTPIQAQIIRYLKLNSSKKIYQRDLERNFKYRRSTISGILKTMEKKGFIERVSSSTDARLKKIVLTSKIESELKILESHINGFEKMIVKDIDQEDLKVFLKVINQIKNNILK